MGHSAQRRAHVLRLRARVRRRTMWEYHASFFWTPAELDLRCAKMAGTRTPCSCWMCGNPRKYANGPRETVQELKWFEAAKADS